jgi:hypothetical protein
MKTIKLSYLKKIVFILILNFILIGVSSFRLKSGSRHLSAGNYSVYHTGSLAQNAVDFVSLISPGLFQMDPNQATANGPSWSYGGIYGPNGAFNTPVQNSVCEIGYSYYGKADAAAVTTDYVSSGTYTEFDITINSNFTYVSNFNNGGGGSSVDRATVLRHELGHAIGLDHSSDPYTLMYFSITVGASPTYIGVDEQRGIRCIYDNLDCQYNEGGSGNSEFSISVMKNGDEKTFIWTSDVDNYNIIGFNILAKEIGSCKLVTLNKDLIKKGLIENSYCFDASDTNFSKYEYYLEMEGDASVRQPNRMISIK